MFSLISFLKNFARTKHWWREELQLPVTITRSFLNSFKWQKLFERYRQLRLSRSKFFTKVISRFKSFSLNGYDLRFLSSDFLRNVWPLAQRAEIRERIASESLQKTRTKSYDVAGHVGRIKTVITKHLRKMFRSRTHKAAECNTTVRINWDKLTETRS